jgi:hypothetical protein
MYNYLFLNDEFAIMISLLLVFSFLLLLLKKYVMNLFFYIFDNVYYFFYILLNINKYIYNYLLNKYIYIYLINNYNQINLFLIYSNIIFNKKIKDNIITKYIKKINSLVFFINITFNVLKFLNNIILNLNEIKKFNILKDTYIYIYLYSLKNGTKFNLNFIC